MNTAIEHLENDIASSSLVLPESNPGRITLTPHEVAAMLGISVSGAYNLMAEPNFPSFKVGRRWFVTTDQFDQWICEQKNHRR